MTDLLSLVAARPGNADLAYNATTLTIQQSAYSGHRGLRAPATTVRLMEDIARRRTALSNVAWQDHLCTRAVDSLVQQVGRRYFSSSVIKDSDTLRRLRLFSSCPNSGHRIDAY